jgi:hypothetical protein
MLSTENLLLIGTCLTISLQLVYLASKGRSQLDLWCWSVTLAASGSRRWTPTQSSVLIWTGLLSSGFPSSLATWLWSFFRSTGVCALCLFTCHSTWHFRDFTFLLSPFVVNHLWRVQPDFGPRLFCMLFNITILMLNAPFFCYFSFFSVRKYTLIN